MSEARSPIRRRRAPEATPPPAAAAADKPSLRFQLLMLELSLLHERLGNLMDQMWKIRQASVTTWVAVLGVGLALTTRAPSDGGPVNGSHFILLLSCAPPLLFALLEANELVWYMRTDFRTDAVRAFLNRLQLERLKKPGEVTETFDDWIARNIDDFPVYDMTAFITYLPGHERHGSLELQASVVRQLADRRTLLFFGAQLVISVMMYCYFARLTLPYLGVFGPPLGIAILLTLFRRLFRRNRWMRDWMIRRLIDKTNRDYDTIDSRYER